MEEYFCLRNLICLFSFILQSNTINFNKAKQELTVASYMEYLNFYIQRKKIVLFVNCDLNVVKRIGVTGFRNRGWEYPREWPMKQAVNTFIVDIWLGIFLGAINTLQFGSRTTCLVE